MTFDTWLLTTIKRITKELNVYDGINYEGVELDEYSQYYGRVIIRYHKTVQTQGMFYSNVCDELEVLEILPTLYDGDEFPGYDRVCLTYTQLANIIHFKKRSWIAALENQKAVYLITDMMYDCNPYFGVLRNKVLNPKDEAPYLEFMCAVSGDPVKIDIDEFISGFYSIKFVSTIEDFENK